MKNWKEKHRACLALANDPAATPGERAAALRKAERISSKHLSGKTATPTEQPPRGESRRVRAITGKVKQTRRGRKAKKGKGRRVATSSTDASGYDGSESGFGPGDPAYEDAYWSGIVDGQDNHEV